MRITNDYKWNEVCKIGSLYYVLAPKNIRKICGVGYLGKVLPDVKSELEAIGVHIDEFPHFLCSSEEQMKQAKAIINKKWALIAEKEIAKLMEEKNV